MGFFKRTSLSSGGAGHDMSVDLKPFINYLIVLVPVLMLSAEFAKISIIFMKLPEGRGSQTNVAQKEPPITTNDNKLMLTMIVTDSVVTIGAQGGFLPSLFYKEFHRYVARDDRTNEKTIEYDPSNPTKPVVNDKTGKPFALNERSEILLYTADENHVVIKCLYTKDGEMLTDADYNPIQSVNVGDTVYLLRNPRVLVVVKNPAEFTLQPLIAYDEMKNRLMKIKERFKDADDNQDIIIAAENQVAYDKIVQLMDVAREAEFPNISIAKLRS
jgi:biopolymer transport protein ExbD